MQEFKFYYKFKNNRLPYYLQHLPFNPNINIHNYNTTIQCNIQQMKPYYEYDRKYLSYDIYILLLIVPLWNLLRKRYSCSPGLCWVYKTKTFAHMLTAILAPEINLYCTFKVINLYHYIEVFAVPCVTVTDSSIGTTRDASGGYVCRCGFHTHTHTHTHTQTHKHTNTHTNTHTHTHTHKAPSLPYISFLLYLQLRHFNGLFTPAPSHNSPYLEPIC